MRTAKKTTAGNTITYTFPIQPGITKVCVVTVQKTSDKTLTVTYSVDESFGSIDWPTFCANLEAGITLI
jgi:hypothetical protein